MLSNRYKNMLENARVLRVEILDMVGIVTSPSNKGRNKGNERSLLPNKKNILIAIMAFIALLLLQSNGQSYANSTTIDQQDNYKLYAHNKIFKSQQYECYVLLINAESHWNPHVAANHGSYGMVQGKDVRLNKMDAYQQIDWSIKYINHRYHSMCMAWQHEQTKHWY